MLSQPHPTEADIAAVDRRGPTAGVVGAGVAVAFVLVVVWWGDATVWLMPVAGFLAVTASVVDWQTRRVPNRLNLAALIVNLPIAVVLAVQGFVEGWDLAAGVALMAGPLLGAHLLTRTHMPGLGDVKLGGVLGITLGAVSPMAAYAALLGSLVLGATFGVVHRRHTGQRAFPLAPAISVATVLVLIVTAVTSGGE